MSTIELQIVRASGCDRYSVQCPQELCENCKDVVPQTTCCDRADTWLQEQRARQLHSKAEMLVDMPSTRRNSVVASRVHPYPRAQIAARKAFASFVSHPPTRPSHPQPHHLATPQSEPATPTAITTPETRSRGRARSEGGGYRTRMRRNAQIGACPRGATRRLGSRTRDESRQRRRECPYLPIRASARY